MYVKNLFHFCNEYINGHVSLSTVKMINQKVFDRYGYLNINPQNNDYRIKLGINSIAHHELKTEGGALRGFIYATY